MRRFGCLALAMGALVALAGCEGRTTGATNVTNTSATLNATARCDSGERCKWYWEYWAASEPRSTRLTTPVAGPVNGPTSDVNLSTNIPELTPDTTYRWVICGSPNNGGSYACVGPNGTVGSTSADPPPDYGTFTTLGQKALAERWNGTSWTIQPTPTGAAADLRAVSCASTTACTAVGISDPPRGPTRTLAERWNGTSWSIQTTPNHPGSFGLDEFNFLDGVSCASATACAAVGFHYTSGGSGKGLAEHWNGTSWAIQTTPNAGGHSELDGVSCTSAAACTAVGNFHQEGLFRRTLAERWNGTSWSVQSTADPPGLRDAINLSGVSCTSATVCTAVGYYGDGDYPHVYRTLAERWNGTSWTIQATPNPAGAQDSYLHDVSCTSATACTAVGAYDDANGVQRTLAARWNGTTWTIQTTPNPGAGGSLRGVSCTSATVCTAVGVFYDANGDPRTLAARWNGTSWAIQATPNPAGDPSATLSDVSCTSATACTAVGSR